MDTVDKHRLKREFGLDYHVDYALLAEERVGLRGKRVLEVGGSLPERFCLETLGAERWLCVDEPMYWREIDHDDGSGDPRSRREHLSVEDITDPDATPRHAVVTGDVLRMPGCFAGRFDVVFSVAAFEHIGSLGLALDRMFEALRPGGRLFSVFAPIWSSHDGHHLPRLVDASGRVFHGGSSPIPPWGHLLMRPPELYRHLLDHTDPETAAEIVRYVYHSPHINRLFVEDYVQYVRHSRFIVDSFELVFPALIQFPGMVQAERRDRLMNDLRAALPGRDHFGYGGIRMILRKPE